MDTDLQGFLKSHWWLTMTFWLCRVSQRYLWISRLVGSTASCLPVLKVVCENRPSSELPTFVLSRSLSILETASWSGYCCFFTLHTEGHWTPKDPKFRPPEASKPLFCVTHVSNLASTPWTRRIYRVLMARRWRFLSGWRDEVGKGYQQNGSSNHLLESPPTSQKHLCLQVHSTVPRAEPPLCLRVARVPAQRNASHPPSSADQRSWLFLPVPQRHLYTH